MKANELRIGNFISDYEAEPNKTIYWQVETIEYLNKTLGIRFRNGSCWTCEEMIEPIPLTEEWLLKFGFKELKRFTHDFEEVIYGKSIIAGQDYNSEMLAISMPFKLAFIGEYLIDEDYILNVNINYVHQLQNLYFALTGEELTLKS